MTIRDRVRSNLYAHLVDAHGWPEPRPRRRRLTIAAATWWANRRNTRGR